MIYGRPHVHKRRNVPASVLQSEPLSSQLHIQHQPHANTLQRYCRRPNNAFENQLYRNCPCPSGFVAESHPAHACLWSLVPILVSPNRTTLLQHGRGPQDHHCSLLRMLLPPGIFPIILIISHRSSPSVSFSSYSPPPSSTATSPCSSLLHTSLRRCLIGYVDDVRTQMILWRVRGARWWISGGFARGSWL